jgi:hypothetical protein
MEGSSWWPGAEGRRIQKRGVLVARSFCAEVMSVSAQTRERAGAAQAQGRRGADRKTYRRTAASSGESLVLQREEGGCAGERRNKCEGREEGRASQAHRQALYLVAPSGRGGETRSGKGPKVQADCACAGACAWS